MKYETWNIVGYVGSRGSGKTFLMNQELRLEPRVILFSLAGDFKFDDFGVICDTLEDAVTLATRTDKFRIRVEFKDERRVDALFNLGLKTPHGRGVLRDTVFAVDEFSFLCSSHHISDVMEGFIRLGRHSNNGLRYSCQRYVDITPICRSQANAIHLFNMHEPADLAMLSGIVNNANELPQLKVGEYITWQPTIKLH